MFQGEFDHTLDEKNRVVLPAGLRKCLSEQKLLQGFTLVNGRKAQCLELHPMQDWIDAVDRRQSAYTYDNEEAEEYFRDLLSTASDFVLDKQYRFVVPEARKIDAGIDKELVFIGMWKKIEIWDKKRWEERRQARAGLQSPPPPQVAPSSDAPRRDG